MKDGYIRVASASFEVKLGNVKENAKQIIEQINIAKEKDIQILVFPELCLTGYTLQDIFFQARVLNEAKKQLIHIKEYAKYFNMLVVVGLPLEVKNKL